jgi:hypothetical protein
MGIMSAQTFVKACKNERDAMLALYADGCPQTAVSKHLEAANLTQNQRTEVIAALDLALTDAFYTVLMGLAGAGSLGGGATDISTCRPTGTANLAVCFR